MLDYTVNITNVGQNGNFGQNGEGNASTADLSKQRRLVTNSTPQAQLANECANLYIGAVKSYTEACFFSAALYGSLWSALLGMKR